VPQSPRLADTLAAASRAIARVLAGESLNAALAPVGDAAARSRPAVQDLCYGTLRDYGAPDFVLRTLARKRMPERSVQALLLCALHELRHERRAPYVVVDEAVSACAQLGCGGARGFVNGMLRTYLRRRAALEADAARTKTARYGYPQWWIARVERAYPDTWTQVLGAGNLHPPMTLRVNRRKLTAEAYLAKLVAHGVLARRLGDQATRLDTPRPVEVLPGFAEGEVSVQDAGAQLAGSFLDLRDGMRVLDACAAPGGKTGHILELASVDLLAIDCDPTRVQRLQANLDRLGLRASVQVADAGDVSGWWDGRPFDRILLDAPCTASGVVRRHPDMKWLRRASDLARFASSQLRLLEALWQVLAPNGKLLYATCSVFPEENGAVAEAFSARHSDARRLQLLGVGDGQLMPDGEHDGFFYALFQKT